VTKVEYAEKKGHKLAEPKKDKKNSTNCVKKEYIQKKNKKAQRDESL